MAGSEESPWYLKPQRPKASSLYFVSPEQISQKSPQIRHKLYQECRRLIRPYRDAQGGVMSMQVILASLRETTLDHSIAVGLIDAALCQRYPESVRPRVLFQIVAGLIHDVGKEELPELFHNSKRFNDQERDVAKDHVFWTCDYLGDDYPTLRWLVAGHHLHGQPDQKPYPEEYRERNKYMKSLQVSLAVADKATASIELRPELSKEELQKRQTLRGLLENLDRLYGWFAQDSFSARGEIDYVKKIIQQMMIITRYDGKKIDTPEIPELKQTVKDGQYRLEFSLLRLPQPEKEFAQLLIRLFSEGRRGDDYSISFEPGSPQTIFAKKTLSG